MIITDLLSSHNVVFKTEGHHHCRPGWVQVDCPLCGKGSEKYHLGLSTALTGANCWRCGPQGLTYMLHLLTGESYNTCKKLISDTSAVHYEEKTSGTLVLPKGLGPMQSVHKSYLRKRGFDWGFIESDWGVQGIGVAAKLQWRLFIPIYSNGTMVSWTTRCLGDKGLRYVSAGKDEEAVSKKRLLYGEQYAGHSIAVCEGPMDVWRIGLGAVATLGTGFSLAQVDKISKYPERYIVFDNEPTAQTRANQLCDLLSVFPGKTCNIVLDADDPGSASTEEINRIRRLIR